MYILIFLSHPIRQDNTVGFHIANFDNIKDAILNLCCHKGDLRFERLMLILTLIMYAACSLG
jgi:hypothetical protein